MPRDRSLRRCVVVALSAAVLVWAGPAAAIKDKRDANAMFSALNDLMQFAAPGRSVVWDNPETGNSGDITAKGRDDRDGRVCWAYERSYADDGTTQVIKGTACEIVPGLWEIVTESAAEARIAEPEPLKPAPAAESEAEPASVPEPAPSTAQPEQAPEPSTAQPDPDSLPAPVLAPGEPAAEPAVATAEPGPEPSERAAEPAAVPAPAESEPDYDRAPNYDRAKVRETQRLLANLGYNPGPVDGAFGSKTKKAIIAFQRDAGLAQTGEPSAALLAKLREGSRTGSVIEASTPSADDADVDTAPPATPVPGGGDDEPWLAPTSMPTPSSPFAPSSDSAPSSSELIVPPPPPPEPE